MLPGHWCSWVRLPFLCALVLATGCFSTSAATDRDTTAARCALAEDGDQLADQVLQLINLERAQAELPPVVVNPTLSKIAGDYACRMIQLDFFGHEDPVNGHGPGDRAEAGKYAFYAIGENLAAGQQTAAEVMEVWMESPPHREIILDERWKEVGIAVRAGGDYAIYWVQEFGDPTELPTFARYEPEATAPDSTPVTSP